MSEEPEQQQNRAGGRLKAAAATARARAGAALAASGKALKEGGKALVETAASIGKNAGEAAAAAKRSAQGLARRLARPKRGARQESPASAGEAAASFPSLEKGGLEAPALLAKPVGRKGGFNPQAPATVA
jgi:hypothetical protein